MKGYVGVSTTRCEYSGDDLSAERIGSNLLPAGISTERVARRVFIFQFLYNLLKDRETLLLTAYGGPVRGGKRVQLCGNEDSAEMVSNRGKLIPLRQRICSYRYYNYFSNSFIRVAVEEEPLPDGSVSSLCNVSLGRMHASCLSDSRNGSSIG